MSNIGNKEIMARNIKRYIKLSGKTRKEISKELNIPYSTFTDWCNGNIYPRIDKIEKMAYYFGIEKSDLIEDKSNKATFNIDIKELRQSKGLSQMEMAKELNITVEELKAYEKGLKKVPFEFLKQLADYFDIDMSRNIGLNYTKDINEGTFGASMRVLEITKRWNDEVGETSFSNDEITKLIEYAKFLISQRNQNK